MGTEYSPESKHAGRTPQPPLALIAGPTASGKSDCAVELALALESRGQRAVVINADSAQVYRDLRILSARPSDGDMRGIEHRLFGSWDGAMACSAADWAAAARAEIVAVHQGGGVPIVVGGTGLYMRTLLDGIAPVPAIDPAVRDEVRGMPLANAYAALTQEDPQRAAALAPADSARVLRALEVVRSTGRTLGEWQRQTEGGIAASVALHPLVLLPERDVLYARCDRRFALMIKQGALAEVSALLSRQLDPALPVMRAIGVPELGAVVRGEHDLDAAEALASQATRNYAKRQFTWFRRQPPGDWTRHSGSHFNPIVQFETLLRNL